MKNEKEKKSDIYKYKTLDFWYKIFGGLFEKKPNFFTRDFSLDICGLFEMLFELLNCSEGIFSYFFTFAYWMFIALKQ